MKTAELTGAALDWAVAQCEELVQGQIASGAGKHFKPSTDWAHGGPIIEREWLTLGPNIYKEWFALASNFYHNGDTPLVAAMRCYVASKLGDEIEVPDEVTA